MLYRIALWTKLQCSDMTDISTEESSESSSEDDVSPESQLPNVLDRLRNPTPSDLAKHTPEKPAHDYFEKI